MGRGLDLVRLLADGRFHSGEVIAGRLGISRAAIWKSLARARDRYGLAIESVRGRGYRLRAPLELLDAESIVAALRQRRPAGVARLEIHDQIDSTNSYLMAEAQGGAPSGTLCLAERQTAGRGRRGRSWVSPFGANVYLSVLWRYPLPPAALGGASLAAGVAVAAVLADLGVEDLTLKWPNDILWQRRKLGGLLLEVAGEAQGPSHLVAGLGLNLRMEPAQGAGIDQPWTDLASALPAPITGRNLLVAELIAALCGALEQFGRDGLAPFLKGWEGFDRLRGEGVSLHLGEQVITGTYLGIEPTGGALLLETDQGTRSFHAGEVSLGAPRGWGP